MKIKKRLICFLMVMLIVCSIIRIGNIYVLCFGDYSKKNVYAASFVGSYILKSVDGVGNAGIRREYFDFGVSFGKGYEFIYINPGTWWYIMGAFDIHNFGDSINSLKFKIPNYHIHVYVDKDVISFQYIGKSENDMAYFKVKDGKIISVKDEYKMALEEHGEALETIITKSEEITDDYKGIMKQFCRRAVVFETVGLAICIILIVLLAKWYRKIREE